MVCSMGMGSACTLHHEHYDQLVQHRHCGTLWQVSSSPKLACKTSVVTSATRKCVSSCKGGWKMLGRPARRQSLADQHVWSDGLQWHPVGTRQVHLQSLGRLDGVAAQQALWSAGRQERRRPLDLDSGRRRSGLTGCSGTLAGPAEWTCTMGGF